MRGATVQVCRADCGCAVSIHAPHAGRDPSILRRGFGGSRFNPRAPCGARHPRTLCTICILSFNPRAPCGARRDTCKQNRGDICFNPRAPCGARQAALHHRRRHVRFNPRAPCGARRGACRAIYLAGTFQSTRPMRGATRTDTGQRACTRVSIHAPHAGRDPRPPQGRYHKEVSIHAPHAGRDFVQQSVALDAAVSIHAPRAGRDSKRRNCHNREEGFNPRAPCGARPPLMSVFRLQQSFNPRAPCGARQQKKLRLPSFATYSWVLLATNMIFLMP